MMNVNYFFLIGGILLVVTIALPILLMGFRGYRTQGGARTGSLSPGIHILAIAVFMLFVFPATLVAGYNFYAYVIDGMMPVSEFFSSLGSFSYQPVIEGYAGLWKTLSSYFASGT